MDIQPFLTYGPGIIGMATGICGLVVSIANRRHQIKYAPSKLRVVPKLAFPGPMDEMVTETYFDDRVQGALRRLKTYACIEVANLGVNRQVIHEVGFIDATGKRLPWRNPDWIESREPYTQSQSFPLKLDPDGITWVYIRVWPEDPNFIHGVAYAKTDCNEEFIGTSPIMTDVLSIDIQDAVEDR